MTPERLLEILRGMARINLMARDRYEITEEDVQTEIERVLTVLFKLSNICKY